MNELQMIRTLLAEEPPSPEAVAEGREKLRAEAGGRRRRLVFQRPVLSGMGLTAAVGALTLAVVTLGSAPRAPDQQTDLSARDVLLAAADKQSEPAGGKYWYTNVLNGQLKRVGPADDPYFVRVTGSDEILVSAELRRNWFSRAENHPEGPSAPPRGGKPRPGSWQGSPKPMAEIYRGHFMVGLRAEPASARDRAAWRRDGSPGGWEFRGKDCVSFGQSMGFCGTVAMRPKAGMVGGMLGFGGASEPSFPLGSISTEAPMIRLSELRRLPADPDALRKPLLDKMPQSIGSPDDRLWVAGSALVTSLPVSARVRAAAYRMLADIPGVRSLGTVRDPMGRTGTAVALTGQMKPYGKGIDGGGTYRTGIKEYRLVINPSTGWALATEIRPLKPAGPAAGLQPGALWSYSALRSAGWTDEVPAQMKRRDPRRR